MVIPPESTSIYAAPTGNRDRTARCYLQKHDSDFDLRQTIGYAKLRKDAQLQGEMPWRVRRSPPEFYPGGIGPILLPALVGSAGDHNASCNRMSHLPGLVVGAVRSVDPAVEGCPLGHGGLGDPGGWHTGSGRLPIPGRLSSATARSSRPWWCAARAGAGQASLPVRRLARRVASEISPTPATRSDTSGVQPRGGRMMVPGRLGRAFWWLCWRATHRRDSLVPRIVTRRREPIRAHSLLDCSTVRSVAVMWLTRNSSIFSMVSQWGAQLDPLMQFRQLLKVVLYEQRAIVEGAVVDISVPADQRCLVGRCGHGMSPPVIVAIAALG